MKCPGCKNQIQKGFERCPLCYARINPPSANNTEAVEIHVNNSSDYVNDNIKTVQLQKIKNLIPYTAVFLVSATVITSTLIDNYETPLFLIFLFLFDLTAIKLTVDLLLAVRGFLFPETNALYIMLSRFGNAARIRRMIDEERSQSQKIGDRNLITPRFLISRDKNHFEIIPLEDLIWIYSNHNIQDHKIEYTLTDYKLHRYTMTFSSHDEALLAFETIEKRCPGIVSGNKRKFKGYVRKNAGAIHQRVRGSWIIAAEME